jgi:hypothetical protein
MLTEIDRLNALFAIQTIGVCFAAISILQLRLKPFTNITRGPLMTLMLYTAGVVTFVTVFLILVQAGMISSLCRLIMGNSAPSVFSRSVAFSWAISLCAFMDLSALAILIYATDGPRQSMYTPYLFTIILLIIMLQAPWWTIIGCFTLTVIIFWVCIFYRNKNFEVTKRFTYDLYFGFITSLCVLFPTLVKILNI